MRSLLVAAFLLLPNTASALSCMPYNAVAGFQDAAKANADYIAVLGRLSFNKRDLPKVDWSRQQDVKPDNFLTGRIDGESLTGTGFNAPFKRDIRINVQCAGPWCAGLENGSEFLVFLKRDNGTYLLEVNPCQGFAFSNPTQTTIRKIENCMQGKKCDADLPRY